MLVVPAAKATKDKKKNNTKVAVLRLFHESNNFTEVPANLDSLRICRSPAAPSSSLGQSAPMLLWALLMALRQRV